MDALGYKEKTTIDHTQTYSKTPLAFVRVPKTGGTFLSMQTLPHVRDYEGNNSNLLHLSVSKVESLVQEGTPLFTMLRDPYDRSCSEYYHIKNHNDYRKLLISKSKIDMENINKMSKTEIMNVYATRLHSIYKYDMSIEDYLEYVGDCPIYPRFFDTKTPKDFDCVGITSEMDKTINLLKSMYDVNMSCSNFNKNESKEVKDLYKTGFSRSVFESNNPLEYKMYYEGLKKFQELCKENDIK